MERSRRRSGYVRGRAGCSASIRRRFHTKGISHRDTGGGARDLLAEYAGVFPSIRLEMARALRQLLRARDSLALCEVLDHHPILLLESAPELLRATACEAELRGDKKDEEILLRYLALLELARKSGTEAVFRRLIQQE